MSAQRLSFVFISTLISLAGAAQAQGPWPTMNRPTFFSPVQEFFTPRSYTTYYAQPTYQPNPSTSIIPGVPQCANGQCRRGCPNGQCPTAGGCANGQCSRLSQGSYPMWGASNGNCANGQCGNRNGFFSSFRNWGMVQPGMPSNSVGFRPLSPNTPNNTPSPRGGQLNRLVPIDGGFLGNSSTNAPQRPLPRNRESMAPRGDSYASDSTVRFQ